MYKDFVCIGTSTLWSIRRVSVSWRRTREVTEGEGESGLPNCCCRSVHLNVSCTIDTYRTSHGGVIWLQREQCAEISSGLLHQGVTTYDVAAKIFSIGDQPVRSDFCQQSWRNGAVNLWPQQVPGHLTSTASVLMEWGKRVCVQKGTTR